MKHWFILLLVCLFALVPRTARGQATAVPGDTACTPSSACETPGTPAIDPIFASLYPNPANNDVNVVYEGYADIKNVAVYNIIGKMLMIYKVAGNSANLNIENIPPGIYFVRLINSHGGQVATRKFTKQ